MKKKVIKDTTFYQQEEEEESLREFMRRSLQEKFVENIPMDTIKELPPGYMHVFGVLGYMIALGTMVYFTYTIFQQQTNKRFIALNYDDGDCEPVPTLVSGTYLASTRGKWEGDTMFLYSEALYSMKLTNLLSSREDYENMMLKVGTNLESIGEDAKQRDAAENLLYWMTWSAGQNGANYFEMAGDPTSILNRQYFYGTLSGIAGECQAEPSARFTVATGEMELFFEIDKFETYEYCTQAATPEWMGYVRRFMKNNFMIKIDAWEAMVAISINLGHIPMTLLQTISNTNFTVDYKGETLHFVDAFDFRYPGMIPVTCLIDDASLSSGFEFRACFLRQGDTFMLPVMNHFGTARDFPEQCNCTNGDLYNRECHNLDLMVSVLFYNLPPYDLESSEPQPANNSLYAILALLESDSYYNINRNAYNMSFACCRFGQWTDPVWRQTSYEFCNFEEFGSCSVIMYNPYDRVSRTVSPYYYQVPEIACTDSFTISNWNTLQEFPPQPLNEVYLQCTVPWYEAIFEAQGIASGNAALAVPIIMGVLLPFLFLYMKKTGKSPPKPEYSEDEVRDNKTRGFNKNSLLLKTARELMMVSKQEGGYSDSDDESSEDGNEDSSNSSENEGSGDDDFDHAEKGAALLQGVELSCIGRNLKPTQTHNMKVQNNIVLLNVLSTHSKRFTRRRSLFDCKTAEDFCNALERISLLFDKAMSVRGKNGAGASYRNARNETLNLKNIDLKSLYTHASKDELRECFTSLQKVIRLHACLEFDRELVGTTTDVGKDVGYNLGGRVFTLENVADIGKLGVSPFNLGFTYNDFD